MMHALRGVIFCLCASLFACTSTPLRVPVEERSTTVKTDKAATPKANVSSSQKLTNRPSYKAGDWRPDTYTVKKGDNLYGIGLEYGYDYKEIAQQNNITAPYNIRVGQVIQLKVLKDRVATSESKPVAIKAPPNKIENSSDVVIMPIESEAHSGVKHNNSETTSIINEPKAIREPYSEEAFKAPVPVAKPTEAIIANNKPETIANPKLEPKVDVKAEAKQEAKISTESPEDIEWTWPTKGKVSANFNEASNKGIDITGSLGQAINAAAAGKVIYSGSDLRGYGKLVIIKHNATYLSVYAHNSQIIVKEGQQVGVGQKVAEMGNTDSNSVKLHFEIRRQGKSVDPNKYLSVN